MIVSLRIVNKILPPSRVSVSGISRRMMLSSSRSNTGNNTSEGNCIVSNDEKITNKTLQLTNGSGEHDFGPVEQFSYVFLGTFHGRLCKKCGLLQKYGRAYGTNRYPNFEEIDPNCPPLGEKEGENKQ